MKNNLSIDYSRGIFEKVVDSQGISELFGIGPSHTPGLTIYKNIFELKPAHFAVYNKSGLYIEKYWELKSKKHSPISLIKLYWD